MNIEPKLSKPAEKYIEIAKLLSKEEIERTLSRLNEKLKSRKGFKELNEVEVAAVQLEIEAEQVRIWTTKWAKPKSL